MKNITRKTFKIALIAAAVSAAVLSPFSAATAAEQTGATKTHAAAIVNQANAITSAAVAYVTSTQPAPLESSTLDVIAAGKTTKAQEMHAAGVYVGKGLILVSNELFAEAAEYQVTLADGKSVKASFEHEAGGLLFLRLDASEGLPKPVTVDATHQEIGADVAVFGLSEVQGGSRHTVMARGYISAPAFTFYSNPDCPQLLAAKTDQRSFSTDLGPVFSRSQSGEFGELIGMTVLTQEGEAYFVPSEFFKPILTTVLAGV